MTHVLASVKVDFVLGCFVANSEKIILDAWEGVFSDIKLKGIIMCIYKDRFFSKLGRLRYLKVQ